MADILPGYTYDRRGGGRYRDQSSGRFVSRRDIQDLLDRQIESAERRLSNLTTALHDGRIAPAVWAEQMRTEVRRLTLQNQALGAGGWDRMTQSDFGKAGASLRDTYARLVDLAQGIQAGTVTLPQALNRVDGYIGEARRLYYDASRTHQQASGGDMAIIEKRTLGNSEHCPSCLRYHEQGWQPLGILPNPGEASECNRHCRCSLVSREVSVAEVDSWLGTRR